MKYNAILLMILTVISLSFVIAAPPSNPTTQVSENSMQLEYPKFSVLKQNEGHRFHVHVINNSRVKTNLTTTCYFHLYNETGYDVPLRQIMEFEDYNGLDFAITVDGNNFTKVSQMSYVIQCNSSNEIGFASNSFLVTPSGSDLSDGESTIFFSAIFVLALVAAFFFILGIKQEGIAAKIILIGISMIIFIVTILFTMVGLSQVLAFYPVIIEGFSNFWFIMKILIGVALTGLIIYTLVISYNYWMYKKGFRD